MIMELKIIIFSVFIGFIIGYITNKLAIYMLFHPEKKFFGFQGVIPKRKEKIAERISENIHLIFPKEYSKAVAIPFIGNIIDNKLKESISSTIKNMSNSELEKLIKRIVKQELFFIELFGGFLGALIGLIQGLIVGLL